MSSVRFVALVGSLAAVAVLSAGCTVDVSVDEEGGVAEPVVEVLGDVDSCVERDASAGGLERRVCYSGDLTVGDVDASGLQPGSELTVTSSDGHLVVLNIPDDPAMVATQFEVEFQQGPESLHFTGVWDDGEALDFSVLR